MASPITFACSARMARVNRYHSWKFPGEVSTARLGLNRDIAALVLIGIAIGDQPEHPGGVVEPAALVAAQPVAHGAGLNVNVMSCGRVARCRLNHMLDIVDLEPAGHDALVVERVDAAQLQEAGLAGAVDGLLHVLADELDELADGRLVDLRAHGVIVPPSL
jgi:hypothetical protein